MLRRLPGLELAIRGAVPAIEDAVFMDNIANSILVGPNQMGSLHALLLEACEILDMQAPDLYIRQVCLGLLLRCIVVFWTRERRWKLGEKENRRRGIDPHD